MSSIATFHGEVVSAFRHEGDPQTHLLPCDPTITVYLTGTSRGGHVSVIWNLTMDEARALERELGQALASVSGEGEARS